MQTYILAGYVLIWPAVSLAVLVMILGATVKDARAARQEKRDLV
ncbi:hypothetical protein SAMN05216421_0892 [Halopseudomonas xinjiangensis]|uniref:Uncharacterized protein n=1 Tax=Halopseudomonas xinjiangensis TaxID=487184 RepID=A0A1H1PDS0_9GAMM|nr:putative transporter small subunit [Halopseudomonas xinjiangensis]SDS09263.1 hypothetical protein SAMN05216421_0892 [Halopseudomonas xinjiangensis]